MRRHAMWIFLFVTLVLSAGTVVWPVSTEADVAKPCIIPVPRPLPTCSGPDSVQNGTFDSGSMSCSGAPTNC